MREEKGQDDVKRIHIRFSYKFEKHIIHLKKEHVHESHKTVHSVRGKLTMAIIDGLAI